jgi:hypothetical protein
LFCRNFPNSKIGETKERFVLSNVVNFNSPDEDLVSPRRSAIQRWSRPLVPLFQIGLGLTCLFGLILAAAVLAYDGPLLSFGPGGLLVGHAPDPGLGIASLGSFTFAQRLTGAGGVLLLVAPAAFILLQLCRLFRLYAGGIVFAPGNVGCLRRASVGFVLYAIAPALAHALIEAAGIGNDPVWFHFDSLGALLIGAALLVIAAAMQFGQEIEQDRDGFV